MFDSAKIKKDFPIFAHHKNLVYLDSTATALKPQQVIDKENEYYSNYSANIFRGIYKISERATSEYELVRESVAKFIEAESSKEIVFVRNATEAINLVAHSWGELYVQKGDSVIATIMEHHANFVTWQELCKKKHAQFLIADITNDGLLDDDSLFSKLSERTRLVALTHVSNVLGTINPIKDLIAKIKNKYPHCLVLVDGAQAVPHMGVSVADLGCDFYVFSSHKMLGPTGVGVLWGKKKLLDEMPPYQYGGEMIQAVYTDHTLYKEAPYKFEAGTPHIAGVIGLGAAIEYLSALGMNTIRTHEEEMCSYLIDKVTNITQIDMIGTKSCSIRGGVLAFTIKNIHPHDIAQLLDDQNICIRSGHHCAMPLHTYLSLPATARASIYIYTTKQDIDQFIEGLNFVIKKLS